jgi:phage shock protein PspC (stress-responsive transcriptional regulator)
MEKTININLAGTLFQIEDEAYRILRDYLQAINHRFKNVQGGYETVEDIESRIAEIFQTQKGLGAAISKGNVEEMISIIGKPEDFDINEAEPEPALNTSQRRRMYRNPDDSIVSGVCGGIGAYLNTDPVLFRILFVLFALFFGSGFLLYIVLWIALPYAHTETQKKEMYGNEYHAVRSYQRQPSGANSSEAHLYGTGYNNTSRAGNAFNEIFRAIGRVGYIFLRIFLIICGVVFVLTGALAILSFVMIFIFKYPGSFSTEAYDMNLAYLPDFLNYIINPSVTPWVIVLAAISFILPMVAFIYWGVKMIFWFKARDGIVSLVFFVIWALATAALTYVLVNEGLAFADSGKSITQNVLSPVPDTLYVKSGNKISDLQYDVEFKLHKDKYTVLINDSKKELYFKPCSNIYNSGDGIPRVEVRKRSAGRTKQVATRNTSELLYNYSLNGDTLLIDEYFTIPSGRKWSADNVGINLYIPKGTILKFDNTTGDIFDLNSDYDDDDNSGYTSRKNSGNMSWVLTDDGLKPAIRQEVKNK